jgi:hypothetical protein
VTKRGPKPDKCTEPELAFIRARLEGLSQLEAMRRAGYGGTETTLTTSGCRLEAKPRIQAELARRRAILDAKSNMTREARLALVEQMIVDPALEPRDRLKALELRAKMGGDFIERRQIENTGPAGGPVKVEIVMTRSELHEEAKNGMGNG